MAHGRTKDGIGPESMAFPQGLVKDPSKKARKIRKIAREIMEEEGLDIPKEGKAPTPEENDGLLQALGINFTKLGYKPRPAYTQKGPTPYDVIQQLASLGLTQRQVHLCLGWSSQTWESRKADDPHIMECYDMGFSRGIGMIANRHFMAAMQGSIPALQFILKTKGGFTEPKEEKIGPEELARAIKQFLMGVDQTTGLPPAPPEEPSEPVEE